MTRTLRVFHEKFNLENRAHISKELVQGSWACVPSQATLGTFNSRFNFLSNCFNTVYLLV
jgi:hypothetical protein